MVDIHCHILYDLDDGAESLDDAIEMARIAYTHGTTHIVATPHTLPEDNGTLWQSDVLECTDLLNTELAGQGIGVKLYTGCEVFGAGDFLQRLKDGRLFTLNNSIYPLVEFDFYEHPASVLFKLGEIVAQGFIPIVAHPERYAFINEDVEYAKKIKDLGCLIQLNKGSITGNFGSDARLSAQQLLSSGLADFVASDAHSPFVRTPVLSEAYDTVCKLFSEDYANLLFNENPLKVLNNQKI